MKRIDFVIPGRPKGKDRPRSNPKGGRPYTPKETVAAEREILRLFRLAARSHEPPLGPIKLSIIAVFAIPQSWPKALREAAMRGEVWHVGKPDIDNIEKLVFDALNGWAYRDDGQVAVVTKGKRYGSPARTDVSIIELDQPDGLITPGQRRAESLAAEQRESIKLGRLGRKSNMSKKGLKMPPSRGFSR